ncbi:MAG: oxidative damage protection protein [Candidatus Palauibacterales bacterium]|jgi:Fe-S cluster biosynthesis and repair protein YggX|nr:oxidative damage protection protein [Candidatus Palauibacterales bacterium]MDP2483800.1 oxidative damage protection protein [Candidatus Palauibacterales bacterium]
MTGEEPIRPDGMRCARCERPDREPLPRQPFPNELGQKLAAEICTECWDEWKQRQMLLINHYGLDVREPRSREFLLTNLRSFLFGEGGEEAEIDSSEEGTVSW